MSDVSAQLDQLRTILHEALIDDEAVAGLAAIPGATVLKKAANLAGGGHEVPIVAYSPNDGLSIRTGVVLSDIAPVPHTLDRLSVLLIEEALAYAKQQGWELPHTPQVVLVAVSVLPAGALAPGC